MQSALVSGTVLAIYALSAVSTAAQTRPGSATDGANFCARITSANTTLGQRFSNNESKLNEARGRRDRKIDARQQEQNSRLVQTHQQANQTRAAQIAALMAKAATDAQKQAVTDFQNTLNAALATRRAAVDGAIATFRSGLDTAIAEREAAINAAIKVYHDAVNAALDKAKSDCASGVAPLTARQTFFSAMRAAQQKFRTDRRQAEKIPASVQQLRTARKQAIDKAFADFRATMEQARKTLKAAFAIPAP